MINDKYVNIIGSGGHAKVVISLLRSLDYQPLGIYDDDPRKKGTELMGVPIRGAVETIIYEREIPSIIAIGNNDVRKRISNAYKLNWLTLIHPRAYIDDTAKIDEGSVVFAGSIVQPFTRIGKHVIINTSASIDHDCIIGDFCQIAPGVHLSGTVSLGEGSFLGTGCCTIQNISVGEWTTVGAGAVVIHNLPSNCVAVGVPAKIIKNNQ